MKIALPNKGSLAESSSEILREAGYKQRSDARDLTLFDNENGFIEVAEYRNGELLCKGDYRPQWLRQLKACLADEG